MRFFLLLFALALSPIATAQHIDSLVVRLERAISSSDTLGVITAADGILKRRGPRAADGPTLMALFSKAGALSALGRHALALPLLSRVVSTSPAFAGGWASRAEVYADLKLSGRAAEDYGIAAGLAGAPEDAFLYRKLEAHYLSQDDQHAASDSVYAILLADESQEAATRAQLVAGRGEVRYRAGDVDAALADFAEALRLVPDDPLALLSRVDVYLREDRLDEALVDLDRTLALDPDTVPAYLNGIAFVNRGFVRWRAGKRAEAAADVESGLRHYPENPFAYRVRALLHLKAEDTEAACADLGQAMLLGYYERFGPHYRYGPDVRELLTEHCALDP